MMLQPKAPFIPDPTMILEMTSSIGLILPQLEEGKEESIIQTKAINEFNEDIMFTDANEYNDHQDNEEHNDFFNIATNEDKSLEKASLQVSDDGTCDNMMC